MTNREKVVVMAYTGICTLTGDKLDLYYQYLEELFGRPVFTHEISSLMEEIQKRSKPEFIRICQREEEERTKPDIIQICQEEKVKLPTFNYYRIHLLGDNTTLPVRFKSYQEAKVFILDNHLSDAIIETRRE